MKTSKTFSKGKLVMFLLILLMACEKEPHIDISQEEQAKIDMDYLSIEQLPQLEQALSDVLSEKASKFISGKTLKYKKARIDVGNILKVRSLKNSINYTMHVFVEGAPENEFYNLITHKTPSGKFKKPYVLRYVVDEDAMDAFVANNYNFSYFKGVRYAYKFDNFFKDYEIGNKSSTGDCDEGTVITNVGQAGNGGIRDIPVTNNLQTDSSLYNFDQSNGSESFFLYFNSYDDKSGNDTSYGSSVQSDLIQVTTNDNPNDVIQLPPLGTNISGAITLVSVTVSKPKTTKNAEGSMTGCTITITREYSDGTIVTILYNCLEAPLKPGYYSKSPDDDCPENEGETGVLTIDVMVAEILDAYGLSVLTKPRLMYLNSSPITPSLYNYLNNNNFSDQVMEMGLEVIDIYSGLDEFSDSLNSSTFNALNNPWLNALREYAKKLAQLKNKISNELWNSLNQYLDRQLVKALNKTAFSLYDKANTSKESNKQHLFETDGKKSVAILLYEFANGEGPDEREFPFSFDITQQMLSGNLPDDVKTDFENKLIEDNLTYEQFVLNGNGIDGGYSFSPDHTGVIDSFNKHINANWVQFFIGGTSNTYYPSNEQGWIIVEMRNPTSRNSLLLHVGESYDRKVYSNIPLSTIEQVFRFKLKIK